MEETGGAAAAAGGGGFPSWNDIRSLLMVSFYEYIKQGNWCTLVIEEMSAHIQNHATFPHMSWGKSKGEREQMARLPLSEARPFCLFG